MSKQRVATSTQIFNLNALGAIRLAEPDSAEVISYQDAWDALAAAKEQGLWQPKVPRDTDVPKVGLEREGWDSPPEAA